MPWLWWSYATPFLPVAIHGSEKKAQILLSWLRRGIANSPSAADVQCYALGMGLTLRDIHTAQFCTDEDGELTEGLPEFLLTTALTMSKIDELLQLCTKHSAHRPRPVGGTERRNQRKHAGEAQISQASQDAPAAASEHGLAPPEPTENMGEKAPRKRTSHEVLGSGSEAQEGDSDNAGEQDQRPSKRPAPSKPPARSAPTRSRVRTAPTTLQVEESSEPDVGSVQQPAPVRVLRRRPGGGGGQGSGETLSGDQQVPSEQSQTRKRGRSGTTQDSQELVIKTRKQRAEAQLETEMPRRTRSQGSGTRGKKSKAGK